MPPKRPAPWFDKVQEQLWGKSKSIPMPRCTKYINASDSVWIMELVTDSGNIDLGM